MKAFVTQWNTVWEEHPHLTIYDVAQALVAANVLRTARKERARNIHRDYQECRSSSNSSCSALTNHCDTQFADHLNNQYDASEARERNANVEELLSAASARAERGVNSPAAFLEEVALIQDHAQADAK